MVPRGSQVPCWPFQGDWQCREGRGLLALPLDPARGDPVWGQAAVGACSPVLPTQRGALCCLAEPTGLWFLT